MENRTSPGHENLGRLEMETADNTRELAESIISRPSYPVLSTDDLAEDFANEEPFVLREDYVLMEEEYVMWEGTTPCQRKNRTKGLENGFEGEISLPEADSLQYLGKYFTLKTENRVSRHY